jgi:hypothetical protein
LQLYLVCTKTVRYFMNDKILHNKIAGIVFAVLVAFSVFTVALPSTASESTMVKGEVNFPSVEAKSVLRIENAKSNLTDAQKKLSTDLLQLIDSRGF